MKANAGTLTNFEVLDLLNSRGASNDTTRVIAPITTLEYKVLPFFFFTCCYFSLIMGLVKFNYFFVNLGI